LTVGEDSFSSVAQFKWSEGWTQFIPFVYKETQYYLAYKQAQGKGKKQRISILICEVHVTQIKDNLSLRDVFVSKEWPTNIELIYAFSISSEPFFMLHSTDNKIRFLKLSFGDNLSFNTVLARDNVDVQTKCSFVDKSLNKLFI
jgi:hypothetical protein